jgi:hypothetical protein
MADRKVIARNTAARSFRKYEKSKHETYVWIHDFLNHLALERKVLMRQEDEEEIVNYIGRSFGYYTGKSTTHTIQ